MKVALIFPPVYGVDFPHLGLAYIAAKIREDGHEVKIFCFNSRLYRESGEAKDLWGWFNANLWIHYNEINKHFDIEKTTDRWAAEVLEYGPEAVGLCVNTHSKLFANILASKIKKGRKATAVIFGGPLCSEGLGKLSDLNADVDIFVKGEGEGIVSIILDRIARREPFSGIRGTIFNDKGVLKDNGENDGIAAIDQIPLPAFDLFDVEAYENKSEIPIIFSRGCHYGCRFCSDKPIWGRHRMRKAEHIVEEIRKHKERYGRNRFKCNDLLINGDLRELERLADLLIKENMNIVWGGMARARKDMPEELLRKMKAAGCEYLTFGIESGSNHVLKLMGKPSTQETSITIQRTHAAGIKVNTLWMVGHPGETRLDLIKTMWFLLVNRRHIEEFVNVSPCYIPKNSSLGKQEESLKIEYDSHSDWYIQSEGNFISTRLRRAENLRFLARILGLYKGGITHARK